MQTEVDPATAMEENESTALGHRSEGNLTTLCRGSVRLFTESHKAHAINLRLAKISEASEASEGFPLKGTSLQVSLLSTNVSRRGWVRQPYAHQLNRHHGL